MIGLWSDYLEVCCSADAPRGLPRRDSLGGVPDYFGWESETEDEESCLCFFRSACEDLDLLGFGLWPALREAVSCFLVRFLIFSLCLLFCRWEERDDRDREWDERWPFLCECRCLECE